MMGTRTCLALSLIHIFIKRNEWAGHVAALASEEMSDVYHLPPQYPRGKYLLVFDPLDGSSNTDVNGAVGTIFSILRRSKDAQGCLLYTSRCV